ncbi:hypothetical protein NDU88_006648 [Pleurodeles waltl]|uniref:Uncharacterized protein n=1 Tax=Pleurodeles waltl TaxID=8319 RepID=A0AAV7PN09_PLEWA|nr:hypothetical protein NDU88_006648 [Pleurodeles waltl]
METPFVIGYTSTTGFIWSGFQRPHQLLNHQGDVLMCQPCPEVERLLEKDPGRYSAPSVAVPHSDSVVHEHLHYFPFERGKKCFQRKPDRPDLQKIDMDPRLHQRPEASDLRLSRVATPSQK